MNYKELSNVFKKISKWDSKKTKVLSIKTRPFNKIAVFSNIQYVRTKIYFIYFAIEKKNMLLKR